MIVRPVTCFELVELIPHRCRDHVADVEQQRFVGSPAHAKEVRSAEATSSGVSHSIRWPAPSITVAPPHASPSDDREQLVLATPEHELRAGDAVQPLAQPAVAERPDQAGGGDLGEVHGDRRLLLAVVGEAVGDLIGHALGEQVGESLGRRVRRRGRSRCCLRRRCRTAPAAPAWPRSPDAARPARRRSCPPTEAPTTLTGPSAAAPVASIASQNTASQSR